MRYTLGLFLLLTVFWGINSTNDSGLLLFLGLLSVLLVMLLTHRMKLLDKESFPLHLITRIGPFYIWLTKEIIVGSIYVLKKIILRDKTMTPRLVKIRLNFKHRLSEVIFANSITLVPGTLCVQLGKGWIKVHALTKELADQLERGELARRIKALED